jgi:hypothetical protein
MEKNPIYDDSSSSSSPTSSTHNTISDYSNGSHPRHDVHVLPATIQMVNIRSHVPVTLDLTNDSNYLQWHHFFDTAFAKFALHQNVVVHTFRCSYTLEWTMNDATIAN